MGDTGLCHRLRRKTSDDALARAEEVVEVVPRGELTLKASPIRCRYSTLPARKRKLASRRRFLPGPWPISWPSASPPLAPRGMIYVLPERFPFVGSSLFTRKKPNEKNHHCNGHPAARRLCYPGSQHGPDGRGGKELRHRKPPSGEGQEFQRQHGCHVRAAAADAPRRWDSVQDHGRQLIPFTSPRRRRRAGAVRRGVIASSGQHLTSVRSGGTCRAEFSAHGSRPRWSCGQGSGRESPDHAVEEEP